jgi:peptide-methionine (S)-S-oxide reductase
MVTERATLGAGCFWHVQWTLDRTPGVVGTLAGYSGGSGKATYKNAEEKGFAEVVMVDFDPDKISYEKLLDVFWKEHNPTTRNRQGKDVGHRYRSVIFYHNPSQKKVAEKSRENYQKRLDEPIVTGIEPIKNFYPAEKEHQKYLEKHND